MKIPNPWNLLKASNTDGETITFTAPVELWARHDKNGKRTLPSFSIRAYSGGPMQTSFSPYPTIVDLNGLKTRGKTLPILRNHDPDRVVGQAHDITIDSSGVELSGVVTGDDADANAIVSHAKNGFQWQASIGASVQRREFLEAGKTATVNGKNITGPAVIAREATLVETSFVAIGGDPETSTTIAAKHAAKGVKTMTENATTTSIDHQAIDFITAGSFTGEHRQRVAEAKIEAHAGTITLDELKATVLEAVRASRPTPTPFNVNTNGSSDRMVAEAGLLALCGYASAAEKLDNGKALQAAQDNRLTNLRAWASFTDIAMGNGEPQLKAGFSTNALSVLMSSVPRMILAEFELAPASCDALADWQTLSNFKETSIYRLLIKGGLEEVGQDGQIRHGSLSEFDTRIELGTFAKMFQITRKAIINDDVSALQAIPRILTQEASRLRGEKFASLLNANPGNFFHNDNANTIDDELSIAGLNAALVALRTQTDADGRALNMQPASLLVHPSNELTARQIVNSTELSRVSTADNAPRGNPFAAMNLAVEVEPRLTSSTAWYLFSHPRNAGVVIGTLNGNRVPIVERPETDADVLGEAIRGYYDFAIVLAEPRAIVHSTGTVGEGD